MPASAESMKCLDHFFHLLIFPMFFIGQGLTALALFCSRNKNVGRSFSAFIEPCRSTLIVVTGAVCRYHV